MSRILVAGVGNVFFSDDGFGSEVARRLLGARRLPPDVEVVDVGIRGMHLAYRVLDGYDVLLLVDTHAGGRAPGTLCLLEHDMADAGAAAGAGAAFDPHGMEPDAVLDLIGALARGVGAHELRRVLVLGCEPAGTGAGMGLSPPVAAAVDDAVEAVARIVARLRADEPFTAVTQSGAVR
ncbi:hydrogenase maturation protease [Actinomycetospora lutea]|uniref:hydrogenase maturation protease n=1 Tax=Actinomycetospora lutea TaxID=663604 RepID=UPI00236630EA|nr:hydrogenase maturation protease [Actinomycetospora lutea]MDD7937615.1 hydrogenase maturation protease [Actinomycetospora lutea]